MAAQAEMMPTNAHTEPTPMDTHSDTASIKSYTEPKPNIACRAARTIDQMDDRVFFQYLAEGAANLVFRICPWSYYADQTPLVFVDTNDVALSRKDFLGMVLRVSKGLQKTLKGEEIMSGFQQYVKPLFNTSRSVEAKTSSFSDPPAFEPRTAKMNGLEKPKPHGSIVSISEVHSMEEYLMDHVAVLIPSMTMITISADHERRGIRCPVPVDDEWGILLPNMCSVPGTSITVEIKPKWLLQSPNAPRGALRCRTCALHASKRKGRPIERPAYMCPLQILHGDKHIVRPWMRQKVLEVIKDFPTPIYPATFERIVDRMVEYLTVGDGAKLLGYIKDLQQRLDPKGVQLRGSIKQIDSFRYTCDLRLAMTLRDCSMYIKVDYSHDDMPIESKLGDLDFKSGEKIPDWDYKERTLLNGGWYIRKDTKEEEPRECLILTQWRKHVPYYW
ncbi:hypothetical protein BS50DRAFT_244195 [Corynespora cassiicola Philippines]|uniref:Inositol-pentakisphosphate 2-kinase n=1 Tax=Corynespora cassiicola Philippines TaxID=1448308 RepID=A0A2T2P398_CORCC|nr:hypothetical protein BS50DRAFT_244195 [Corynespora cassiicola Philippines]